MKKSVELRRRAATVAEFLDAYKALTAAMEEQPTGVATSVMRPLLGKEREVQELDRAASRLAGKAVVAAKGYAEVLTLDVPGRRMPALPMPQAWRYSLDQPWLVEPDYVIAMLEQLVGRIEGDADARADLERSLAGRLAGFVGFPAEVRSIVAQDNPAFRKAGFVAGVVAQVLVTGLGGAVTAAAVAGGAALLKLVF